MVTGTWYDGTYMTAHLPHRWITPHEYSNTVLTSVTHNVAEAYKVHSVRVEQHDYIFYTTSVFTVHNSMYMISDIIVRRHNAVTISPEGEQHDRHNGVVVTTTSRTVTQPESRRGIKLLKT